MDTTELLTRGDAEIDRHLVLLTAHGSDLVEPDDVRIGDCVRQEAARRGLVGPDRMPGTVRAAVLVSTS